MPLDQRGLRRTLEQSCSLALAPRDTPLTIRHIPFDTLRALCHRRGLDEGDRVHFTNELWDGGTPHLELLTQDGRAVRLERRYANMIEVRAWTDLST